MHVLGRDEAPTHRPGTSRKEWKIRPAGKLQDLACVGGRVREGNIACDRDNGKDLHILGRRQGEQKCDCVVLSRIRIDNDLACHAGSAFDSTDTGKDD